MECFLAVDIGASSGRHIVGFLENGKFKLEEVYRFENGMKFENKGSVLYWDIEELFQEIIKGMQACKSKGFYPESMGIDTWGVDFVLLDKNRERIGKAVAYRDGRTNQMDQHVYRIVKEEELYRRTGIQKQSFNTIYQLMALKEKEPQILEMAETFLMIPDYFHYLLTGILGNEYTNATTSQLVNLETREWDWELIHKLSFPEKLFQTIRKPGRILGKLKKEIEEKVGFSCNVVLPATHDTGSAVMAVPCSEGKVMYISSGTWSLMGVEQSKPICTKKSMQMNFTNEGGYEYRYRFLKNIMGLWMIQSIRHEYQDQYSFAQICSLAEQSKHFPSRVDVNSIDFLAPQSMIQAVKAYCSKSNQPIPESLGELAAVVYQSLAVSYEKTAVEIEKLTGEQFETLYVIGGGANADYLNQLTADYTGKTIIAGPTEATAIGNIVAQMLEKKIFINLEEARKCIFRSFPLKKFYPNGRGTNI